MTYNIYCLNCKKILKVESPRKDTSLLKCPICKKQAKVIGKKITVVTSNGPYKAHY